MQEVIQKRFVVEMVGNAYSFYISGIEVDGNPCFTAEISNAMYYRSEASANIGVGRVRAAGFTMKLIVEPLEISYKIGGVR